MANVAGLHLVDTWYLGVLAIVAVTAAVTDLRRGIISNWLTYPAIAVGLIGHTLVGGVGGFDGRMGLVGAAAGLAAGFLPMLAAWLAGGIGGGDAKLMAAFGALAGWRFAISIMFYGLAVGALMALVVMLRRRILAQTLGRILRFAWLLLASAKPADPATASSAKVPFGLALCIGAVLALVEVALRGQLAGKLVLGI